MTIICLFIGPSSWVICLWEYFPWNSFDGMSTCFLQLHSSSWIFNQVSLAAIFYASVLAGPYLFS